MRQDEWWATSGSWTGLLRALGATGRVEVISAVMGVLRAPVVAHDSGRVAALKEQGLGQALLPMSGEAALAGEVLLTLTQLECAEALEAVDIVAERGDVSSICRLLALGTPYSAVVFVRALAPERPRSLLAGAVNALQGVSEREPLRAAGVGAALLLLSDEASLHDSVVHALVHLRVPEARIVLREVLYGDSRNRTVAIFDELERLFFAPNRKRTLKKQLQSVCERRLRAVRSLEAVADHEGLMEALVDRDAQIRRRAAVALYELGLTEWRPIIQGDRGDLRRLANSTAPARIQLLLLARRQNAEMPREAKVLLEHHQGGGFSLSMNRSAGGLSLSRPREAGALSLRAEPEE